jgi:hypothetical protein
MKCNLLDFDQVSFLSNLSRNKFVVLNDKNDQKHPFFVTISHDFQSLFIVYSKNSIHLNDVDCTISCLSKWRNEFILIGFENGKFSFFDLKKENVIYIQKQLIENKVKEEGLIVYFEFF